MKNLFLFFAILIASISEVSAAGNDWRYMRRDPTNVFNINYDIPTPVNSSFVTMDVTSGVVSPRFITIGSGLSYSGIGGSISVSNVPISSITGLQSALDSKLDVSSAFSGDYDDLTDKPSIPDAVSELTNDSGFITTSALSGYLTSSTASSTYVPLTRSINGYALSSNVNLNASDIGLSNVDNTSDDDKPISTYTQDALDLKLDIVDAFSGDYDDLTDKPSIPNAVSELTNDTGFITNSALSGYLTSSTANITYVPLSRTVNGYNLSSNISLNSSDVGLGNVNNTSDVNKPISTATQTALNGKAGIAHTHTAGDVVGGTFDNARISQSNVTQHQTALTIDTSQVSGLTSAIRSAISVTGNGSYNSGTGVITVNSAKCYVGTTLLSDCFGISKSATVSGGNAVFHLTNDGTSTGTALFPNGPQLDSLQIRCDNEVDSPCSFGTPSLSNSNKTITIAVKKSVGINVALLSLTLLGAPAAANSSVVKMTIFGN